MRTASLILIGFLVLASTQCDSQPNARFSELDSRSSIKVGRTVTIKSQFVGLPLVEPHISAHPADNNHLLVAAMVVTDVNRPYESCRLSSFVSKDAGLTWNETAHDWWDYDPWTAILPSGQTVMSWIGTSGGFKDQYPIQFFSSNDGGVTWNEITQTLSGGYDGTKIAALNNEFYFTTVRFRENMGADIILCRREGSGLFEEVAEIDGKGERLNFCEPAILSDGKVVVPASHFEEKIWVQVYDHSSRKLSSPYHVSNNPGGGRGYMRLAADVSGSSAFKDRVYFVRAMGREKRSDGVWLNYSSEKGVTWSEDRRIDLFEKSRPGKALVPSVAVNKNGVLGISWVDSQNDPAQKKNDVYFTVSLDGGKSFQRPVRVTDISSDPYTKGNADVANKFPGGGHYLNVAAKPDGSFQVIWSDSRSGIFELQTCNVLVSK